MPKRAILVSKCNYARGLIAFGKEESERLAQNMPHKDIPGALDENFIMDEMTLILMDPVSGFILAEQIEEKRDASTWHKVTQTALRGLNVTIQQLVGDEASGLTKLATGALNVMKGSDLFHIQQEITKGLTSHLARTLQQIKKKQKDLQKEKPEMLDKFGDHLKCAEGVQEFRRINEKTLTVLTVLHNFFIRRADGTTAAERFFEQKPRDIFTWLLDKVELPRPRKKHRRRAAIIQEKLAA